MACIPAGRCTEAATGLFGMSAKITPSLLDSLTQSHQLFDRLHALRDEVPGAIVAKHNEVLELSPAHMQLSELLETRPERLRGGEEHSALRAQAQALERVLHDQRVLAAAEQRQLRDQLAQVNTEVQTQGAAQWGGAERERSEHMAEWQELQPPLGAAWLLVGLRGEPCRWSGDRGS